jgi:hypothetical protein
MTSISKIVPAIFAFGCSPDRISQRRPSLAFGLSSEACNQEKARATRPLDETDRTLPRKCVAMRPQRQGEPAAFFDEV